MGLPIFVVARLGTFEELGPRATGHAREPPGRRDRIPSAMKFPSKFEQYSQVGIVIVPINFLFWLQSMI